MTTQFETLASSIARCRICQWVLPHPPRPVVQLDPRARILIVGQAPGRRVHETGVPWNDPSGVRLRQWLGVEPATFYDPSRVSIMPIGFCFPGPGPSGDLPPRPECAPQWHPRVLPFLGAIRLTILIGQYAQRYYLGPAAAASLTDTVRRFEEYLPGYLPLPHPSPRNQRWWLSNPWFETRVVPVLRTRVRSILGGG